MRKAQIIHFTFDNYFSDIKAITDNKLPLISQLSTFFTTIKNSSINAVVPEFLIDLPEDLGGVSVPIIDFSYFTEYRTYILNFIRFSTWFFFLRSLYRRIPRLIY